MTDDVLMQVKALDPAPASSDLPDGMWSPRVALSVIDERSTPVQTERRIREIDTQPTQPRRPLLVIAAAFVAVLLFGAVALVFVANRGSSDVAASAPTTVPGPTTVPTTTAPATTTPPSPPLEASAVLSGFWDSAWGLLELGADGSFRVFDGQGAITDAGNYRIDGAALTLASTDESERCPGQADTFNIELASENAVTLIASAGSCEARLAAFTPSGGLNRSQAPPASGPTSTVPAVAQTLEASVTWDGENCTFEAPERARVGDTLTVTYQNESDDVVDYGVTYLISGATVEDLDAYDGFIDRGDAASPAHPAPFVVVVAWFPDTVLSQGPGASDTREIELRTPRVHTVTCFGGEAPPAGSIQSVTSADTGLTVGE